MDRRLCFTLQEEEYVEYLSWQISNSKTMRGYRWFIMTSVPAVLVTGVLLLRIRQWLPVTAAFALAVLWVLYGASAVWKRFIRRKIRRRFLPKMNIQEFREMNYHFGDDGIEYSEKNKKTRIAWKDIGAMLPLEHEFAFCYRGGTILIPYRVFAGEEDMKQFILEYETVQKNR